MRTLIKLALAAVVLLGAYRLGSAYWDHYALQDAIEKTARFSAKSSDVEVAAAVQQLATERGIDIPVEQIAVERRTRQLEISAPYTRGVELAPGFWTDWDFELDVTVYFVTE